MRDAESLLATGEYEVPSTAVLRLAAESGCTAYDCEFVHLARVLGREVDPVRFFSVDPGEMDTQMHADAIPDADPATLARPADVAERLVAILERAESLTNGARLVAADFAIGGRS